MSNSIPISGLNYNLYITRDDFIAIVDSASLTTFRMSVDSFDKYMASSGSVLSASWASRSIYTSYAVKADTASFMTPGLYMITASWSAQLMERAVAGTASLAINVKTASKLEGIGNSYEESLTINNGLTLSDPAYTTLPNRSSLTSSILLPSIKNDSLFFNRTYTINGISGYGKLFFYNIPNDKGKIVFEIGDAFANANNIGPDIDTISKNGRGILFQTDEAGSISGLNRTCSLVFVKDNGKTYLRNVEAKIYSSSLVTTSQVGFYGTASYALNCDYSNTTNQVLPIGAIAAYGAIPPDNKLEAWHVTDGTEFDNEEYPSLSSVISTSYGEPIRLQTYSIPQDTILPTVSKGTFIITCSMGGTGNYLLTWPTTPAKNLYITPSSSVHGMRINNLNAGNYPYTVKDVGTNPVTTYSLTAIVALNGPNTASAFDLDVYKYKFPNISRSYFKTKSDLSHLTWLIQTG